MGRDSSQSSRAVRLTKPVICAKCRHENPPGSNTCGKCQAHLWVVCHHCGQRNCRADSQCAECGGRLHRSALKRVSKRLFGDRQKVSAWQIGLLVVAVWFAYRMIIYFSSYQPPAPE